MKAILVLLLVVAVRGQWNPNFVPGRSTFVHLFEWKWDDIAKECERFLGPYGYGGIQVSPPNENAVITSPFFRPWWERYQPVSYKLETRSGNETQFVDMVRRCNAVGVRIYVDAVINHMTGSEVKGMGTGGTPFAGDTFFYPGVPFNSSHFNKYPDDCPSPTWNIVDYADPIEVRNCSLSGLRDLKQDNPYVKDMIVGYLNKLVDIGVAGFRIDASKHMWPRDLNAILKDVKSLSTTSGFPPGSRPFIYQEVIDLGNEPIQGSDYFPNGRVTEFKYGMHLGTVFRGGDKLKWFVNWGEGWGMYPNNQSVVFVDNHDNQRGHGAGGQSILTFRDARLYKMATAFTLAHPYGVAQIMSSYNWNQTYNVDGKDVNDWVGPPNTGGNTNSVLVNPDMTCGGGWICEHRWRQIYNMVRFRNVAQGTGINNWWDNGNNGIAFSRGNKGFIAINNEQYLPLSASIPTGGLAPGLYCDVISGNKENGRCTGKVLSVDMMGRVGVFISNNDPDPMVAIHVDSKL